VEAMETVKELREMTGLSQSQFANKYRFTVKQVQSWEQGWRNTPESILYLLGRCVKQDVKEDKKK
jgi:putative transcriptional regulator